MIRTGKRSAQMLTKARMLLAADVGCPGLSNGRIVETLGTSPSSVERTRRRLVEEGLEAALIFMLLASAKGWPHVEISERRTALASARVLKDLADIHFPEAETIVLVQDNLNTHRQASRSEAFQPTEARRERSVATQVSREPLDCFLAPLLAKTTSP